MQKLGLWSASWTLMTMGLATTAALAGAPGTTTTFEGIVQPPIELVRAQATMPDGMELHYYTAGDPAGPAVVLLHGVTLNGMIAWFSNGIGQTLADHGYYVIAPDQRGHGRTGGSTDPDRMPDDPIHLLDALGIDRAHFFGYSMGAMVLEALMASHENRILSATFGGYGIVETERRYQDLVPPEPTPTFDYHAREMSARLEVRDIKRRYDEEEGGSQWARLPRFSAKSLDLTTIPYPVLTLIGEFDNSNKYTYRMDRQIPNYEKHIYSGLGHISLVVPSQISDALLDALVGFLSESKVAAR